MFLQLS